jgi:hypothetical protein
MSHSLGINLLVDESNSIQWRILDHGKAIGKSCAWLATINLAFRPSG